MELNQQKPEKSTNDAGTSLAVNSVFHTIQGEGPFAGSPAIFVRLAGCNLQCPLCDTEYTNRTELRVEEIEQRIRGAVTPNHTLPNLIVLTGGEPFRQPITKLVYHLLMRGFRVQIETNGTLFRPLPYGVDTLTIVCSPKAGKLNRELAPHIDAFKYVATRESLIGSDDGLPMHALEHPNGKGLVRPPTSFQGVVYLQPVDEQNPADNEANLQAVVNSCMKYGYRLCIQIHKLIGVP